MGAYMLFMVSLVGFEPTILTLGRSDRSYRQRDLEPPAGFEPATRKVEAFRSMSAELRRHFEIGALGQN